MASKSFTCKDCGNTFTGGPATKTCPNCGSSNIKVGKNGGGSTRWVKLLAIVVAVIIIIILLLKSCNGCRGPLEASLITDDPMMVKIELSGQSNLSAYRVQVLNGTDLVETMGFPARSNIVSFDKIRMLAGVCYNFRIVTKDGKSVEVHWKTGTQYCVEMPPPAPVIASIDQEPDRDRKVYRVMIIIADTSNADYYALQLRDEETETDNDWQSSNVFNNVAPGEYVAYAKNGTGVSDQPIYLREIKDLPKPLTMQEIQSILDAVSRGGMSPSAAQDKLADGHVDLKRPISMPDGGSISTLWSLLMEASQGTHFKLKGFQNDPNTNRIKSHSLDVSLR